MKKLLLLFCLMPFLFVTAQVQNTKTSIVQPARLFDKYLTPLTTTNTSSIAKKSKVIKRSIKAAQLSKTINVPIAGTLNDLLTSSEKSSITDLTISGNINAHDFKVLRDSMVNLAALDISAVTIPAYSGYDGTSSHISIYPGNEIPADAFYTPSDTPGIGMNRMTSIILPVSVTSIGEAAFAFCGSLTSVSISASITDIGFVAFAGCNAKINVEAANTGYSSKDGVLYNKAQTTLIQCPTSVSGIYNVPLTVNSIGIYAFFFCDKLSTINLSSSVLSIGEFAFTSCSGLINIDVANTIYASQDGVLLNKSKTLLIQCPTSISGSYIIPSSVDSINDNSFYNCNLLSAVSIPSSVVFIGNYAFYNCSGLASITVSGLSVSLGSSYNVFYGVNLNTCILNVPFGSKALYQSTDGWRSFINIVENPHGLILGTSKLILSSLSESKGSVKITSNDAWTAVSDQSWLHVSPQNGSGNDTIVFTAEANTTSANRIALVTVSADGIQPQTIQVTQTGLPRVVNVAPGGLAASITAAELATTLNLKLTGTIDARDFRTMRDKMPKLNFLDLSEVSIAEYTGSEGPASWITAYSANKIPEYSFNLGASSQQYTLASVKLPTSLTAIGNNAFYSCESLSEIVIPNSVTYIGTGAFGSCYNLVNVTLPDKITSIENQAFMGCGFAGITIPNTVKTIGQYGFSSCRNLRSVNIPNSVTTIINSAFENCIALTDLTIGSSVTSIGNAAFNGCSSLASVVIPNSVKTLDGNVFGYCTNLKSVTLPDSLTTISSGSFQNCSSLTYLIIPKTVTRIDNWAFSYCKNLAGIIIPNSVISIGMRAFSDCSGLKSITVNTDIPVDLSFTNDVFIGVDNTTCILNIPFGTKTAYSTANQWKDFVNIIENIHGFRISTDSVKLSAVEGSKASIGISSKDQWTTASNQAWLKVTPDAGIGNDTLRLSADANLSSLQRTAKVTVTSGETSKTLTVIQSASPKILTITAGGLASALTATELSSITDFTINGTIDARDFKTLRDNMPKLENLNISSTSIVVYTGSEGTAGNYSYTYAANEIPQSAFFNSGTYLGKNILNTIILPASATSVGSSAFQYCTGLIRISIPNSVTSIGSSAFVRCSGLTDIKISNSVKSIASNTFQYCSGITGIEIPNSVKSIADYAFQYCSGLTSLVIPDSVTTIGTYSFANCTQLKGVKLGNSLLTVGYSAFQNCTSLTNVIMTNSLKTIGDQAFAYTALTELTIPESVISIGYSSFSNCTGLTEVVLPNSLKSTGNQAFSYCSGLKKVTLGNALVSINNGAFYNCTNLMSIVIPETVTTIESSAFQGCNGLMSITINSLFPVDLSTIQAVFNGVNKTLCTLNVPYQSKILYSKADQWKDFVNINENPNGLKLDLTAARLSSKAGSSVDVNVISNTDWKTASNQSWLTVSSASGSGNKLIRLTAEENVSNAQRIAMVTVSVAGVPDKIITISQSAAAKTVQVIAGGLFASLTTLELNTVSNLVVTGTIDARDFKTMRDNMPLLADLDLSGTSIVAYTGTEGSFGTFSYTYQAAIIPQYAFYSMNTSKAKTSLISVILPATTVSIGTNSFQNCSGLFSVRLPETLTSINDYAFQNCIGLMELTLPNSLLTIGNSSFSGCKGLNNLKIGNSLNTINNNAFENCSALRSVVLPNSMTTLGSSVFQYCTALTDFTFGNSLTSTGSWTFWNCTGLKKIIFPNSMITIGISAFQSCTNLTDITFGNSLTTIGSSAFSSCSRLETIVLPNTVTTLDFRAFMDCERLKNITLSNSLKTIGSDAFSSCYGLTDVTIPNTVTSIGNGAFSSCYRLKNFIFGNSVNYIGIDAFSNCSGLVDVILPNSISTIDTYAFSGCNGMKSITIPEGISSLGYNSISCSGLTAIYSLASVPITPGSSDIFSYVNKSTCILYVPKGSKKAYQSTPQWKDFTNISEDFGFLLANDIIRIKSGGSYTIDFPSNNSFTVESNLPWLKATIISENGNNKIALTSEINPDLSLRTAFIKITVIDGPTKSFTVIQSGSPKTVSVSSGNLRTCLTAGELKTISNLVLVGTIDARDFRVMRDSMPQLADIDLKNTTITAYSGSEGTNPSNYEYAGNETPMNAFYKTYSGVGKETLANVILPTNITSIGKSSFAYASGLASIIIPDKVTTINETAFARCAGLKELVIGNSVRYIGENAFFYCKDLPDLKLPNSLETIASYAFFECHNFKNIIIPNSVTSIGYEAFIFCDALTSVTIGSSVTTMGGSVFSYCDKLSSIYAFPTTPVNFTTYADVFTRVDTLNCVLYVPAGSKTFYRAANQWKSFKNIIEMTTDVPSLLDSKISIYPNPVRESFFINGLNEAALVILTDLNGKQMLTQKVGAGETVWINNLSKGLYITRIITSEGTIERKLIKE